MAGEKELVEIDSKRICLDCLSSSDVCDEVFVVFCPDSEVERVAHSLGFSLCVFVVLPFVPVVTVPSSDVSVVCEANLLSRRLSLS